MSGDICDLTNEMCDASSDDVQFVGENVSNAVETEVVQSRFRDDRQFWRWSNSNCAVATYATVMEFAFSHLDLMNQVPGDSILGRVFQARRSNLSRGIPCPLSFLHDYVKFGLPPGDHSKMSFDRILEQHQEHIRGSNSALPTLMESFVTKPVVTGDFGRPVERHYPARVMVGENNDAAACIHAYLKRCRGPLPLIIQVNITDDGVLPRQLPLMTLDAFDVTKGGYIQRTVQYRFAAIVVGDRRHFKAVLGCPDGVLWYYDSDGLERGVIVPQRSRLLVWPDTGLMAQGYTPVLCMYVLSPESASWLRYDTPHLLGVDSAYEANTELLSEVTGPDGYQFVSGATATPALISSAEILTAKVLYYLGSDGHRVHRYSNKDINKPKMQYWLYEGDLNGSGHVAEMTKAFYDEDARRAYDAIVEFVESGPLGQAVGAQRCALRVSGFLLENINYKATRPGQSTRRSLAHTRVSPDASNGIIGTVREKAVKKGVRQKGPVERLEHASGGHPNYVWPRSGMTSDEQPVPGYTHVDTELDERGASLNVVVTLTSHGRTVCDYHCCTLSPADCIFLRKGALNFLIYLTGRMG